MIPLNLLSSPKENFAPSNKTTVYYTAPIVVKESTVHRGVINFTSALDQLP